MTKSKKKLSRIKDFITPRTFFFIYADIVYKTKKSRSFFRINFDEAKSFCSNEGTFVPSLQSKKGIPAKGLISLSCSFTFLNFSFLKFSLEKFSKVKKSREKSLCSSKVKQRFAHSMCRVRRFVLVRNKSKEKRILKDLNCFYLAKQKTYKKDCIAFPGRSIDKPCIKQIGNLYVLRSIALKSRCIAAQRYINFKRLQNKRHIALKRRSIDKRCIKQIGDLYVLRSIPEGRCNQQTINSFFYSSYKTNYTVVRPLMNFPRRIITMTCLLNKLPVYPDLSNLKTRYSRNRIRKQIIPSIQFFLNPKVEKALFKFSEFYKQQIFIKKNFC